MAKTNKQKNTQACYHNPCWDAQNIYRAKTVSIYL